MEEHRKRMERTSFAGEQKKPNSGSDKHGHVAKIQVGNEFDVRIEEMSHRGEGVVHLEGFTVFIKNTEKNEEVKIKITDVMNTVAHAMRLN